MLTVGQLIGVQEDWANYLTNVEMRRTPFLDWLPVGSRPANPVFSYQVERYRAPRENRHVDGQPWREPASVGEGRAKLKAVIQWFDNGVSVSKLTEDVTSDAAVADQLAHEIPKALKEMASDMEVAALEDYDCLEDNSVYGYRTRGVGSWISAGSQSLYPVDSNFVTPSGSLLTTATGSVVEDDFCDLLASIWNETESDEDMVSFCGKTVLKILRNFQFRLPSSASTAQSTFVRSFKDATISRSVRRFEGDFMDVDFVPTRNLIRLSGSATTQAIRAYFLHRSMWEIRWNQKPAVYKPEFRGGSYEAFMDAIAMLVCKNPRGQAKYAPST
jgi:hypothetical protein